MGRDGAITQEEEATMAMLRRSLLSLTTVAVVLGSLGGS